MIIISTESSHAQYYFHYLKNEAKKRAVSTVSVLPIPSNVATF